MPEVLKPIEPASPPPAVANGVAPGAPPPAAETPEGPPKPREVSSFAKRRHGLNELAKELKTREREADERVRAAEAKAAAAEARATEEATKRAAWEKAPLRAAKEAGQDLDQVIRDGISDNTPERIANEALAEAKKIRDEIAKEKADGLAAQKRDAEQRAAAQIAAERNAFVQAVVKSPEKYRYIHSEWDARTLAEATRQFDEWARAEGKAYSFDEVAQWLDGLAKKQYEQRRPLRRAIEEPDSAAEERDNPPPGRDPRGNGSEPRTTKPKTPSRTLTPHEQEQAELALLRKAMEADRIAASKK
jgi:hypothetical protein